VQAARESPTLIERYQCRGEVVTSCLDDGSACEPELQLQRRSTKHAAKSF
jgi:hypothetical protein